MVIQAPPCNTEPGELNSPSISSKDYFNSFTNQVYVISNVAFKKSNCGVFFLLKPSGLKGHRGTPMEGWGEDLDLYIK